MSALAERALREVRELHNLFEHWLAGRAEGPEAFGRIEAALDPAFTQVPPDGRRLSRAAVLGWLRPAQGSRGATFTIAIEAAASLYEAPPLALVTYVERQQTPVGPTARQATALFRDDPAGPNGVRWIAVQETWIKD